MVAAMWAGSKAMGEKGGLVATAVAATDMDPKGAVVVADAEDCPGTGFAKTFQTRRTGIADPAHQHCSLGMQTGRHGMHCSVDLRSKAQRGWPCR